MPPQERLQDLKRQSVRGGVITFTFQGASIGLQLVSTVVLARLLSPADYGIMTMAMAMIAVAGLLRDLGLSSAIIQCDELTYNHANSLFWINVVMGAALSLFSAACAPLVAWFYNKPELLPLTLALSSIFIISSFGAQHAAIMQREMRFGRKAIADIGGATATFLVAIGLALTGYRYWALAMGTLIGAITTTWLLHIFSNFRPSLSFERAGLTEKLRFGVHLTAFDFINYIHRNSDKILIGKFCGADDLGYYSRAYQLLMSPLMSIRSPLNAVAFPALSRLQKQPDLFRKYYCRITAILAFIIMPLSAFMFIGAKPIIEIVLGVIWLPVAPIFAVLALVGFIQPVYGLVGIVMMSLGSSRRYLNVGIFNTVCYVLSFCIGLKWGPLGVATAYAIATYIVIFPSINWAFADSPVSARDFVVSVARPCIASLFAALVAHFLFVWTGSTPVTFVKLLGIGLTFVALYILVFMVTPGGRKVLVSDLNLYSLLKKQA